jgi:hypothetical protein
MKVDTIDSHAKRDFTTLTKKESNPKDLSMEIMNSQYTLSYALLNSMKREFKPWILTHSIASQIVITLSKMNLPLKNLV